MFNDAESEIKALREALKPFAEPPLETMNDYPCHAGITTKEKCGRCSRAINAWNVLHYNSHTGKYDRGVKR